MRTFEVFLTLLIALAGSGSSIAQAPDPAALPLLEDVKLPLKSGEVSMALADTQSVVFQGDILTVPVKLAAGPGDRVSFTLNVKPILKSDQTSDGLVIDHHWINGYTPNNKISTNDFSEPIAGELSPDLPLTKYCRLAIGQSAKSGTYILQFTLKTPRGVIQRNFKLAVHEGLEFSVPELSRENGHVYLKVRDKFGTATAADEVLIQDGSERFVVAKEVPDETGSYELPLDASKNAPGTVRVRISKTGFKEYVADAPF